MIMSTEYAQRYGLNRRGTACFIISKKALLCQSNDMSSDLLIISWSPFFRERSNKLSIR